MFSHLNANIKELI